MLTSGASASKKNTSRRNAWGNLSYADLITQAISSSAETRLTLSQIYEWMVQNVPYFKDKGDSNSSAGWKVSRPDSRHARPHVDRKYFHPRMSTASFDCRGECFAFFRDKQCVAVAFLSSCQIGRGKQKQDFVNMGKGIVVILVAPQCSYLNVQQCK